MDEQMPIGIFAALLPMFLVSVFIIGLFRSSRHTKWSIILYVIYLVFALAALIPSTRYLYEIANMFLFFSLAIGFDGMQYKMLSTIPVKASTGTFLALQAIAYGFGIHGLKATVVRGESTIYYLASFGIAILVYVVLACWYQKKGSNTSE
jgi:hypothetical protein